MISLLKFIKGIVLQNETDKSKELEISVSSSATASTKTILQSQQSANRTLTLPDDSATLVGDDTTQTLTNKTIDADSNTISNIENDNIKSGAAIQRAKLASGNAYRVAINDASGVLSDASAITASRALISDSNGIPTHSTVTATELATLSGAVGPALTQTNTVTGVTNKTFVDSTTLIQDNSDATKQFKFEASGITTGTTRTLTVPDLNDSLVVRTSTDTLSNKTLDNSTVLTIQDSNLTIQDNSDNTKQMKFQASGITTGTTRTFTVPDADATLLGAATTQIITNKDIDGGTAANNRRITVPKDTKSNLDALTRKEGTIVYATDEDKLYVDDGSQLVGTGGLDTVQFTIANNQSSPANVTGFLLNQASNKTFSSNYSIVRIYQGTIGPLSRDTTYDTNIGTGFGPGGNYPNTFLSNSSGIIFAGGTFTQVNGVTNNHLVALNQDGTLYSSYNTNLGSGFSSDVVGAAIQTDDKLIVLGNFATFNGNSRNWMVRLNADGTEDSTFYSNLGSNFNALPLTVAIQSDGKIVIGGTFTTFNGNTTRRILRLNSDGTEDTSFSTNAGIGANNTVNSVAIQSDGKILLGGNFTSFNGTPVNRILRLNSDGTIDSSFLTNIGTGFDNAVARVVVDSSGNIYAGGQFSSFNGNTRNYINKLASTGIEDATFVSNVGTGFDSDIRDLIVAIDSKLYVVGSFTDFNGNTRNKAVRLNTNGTEDSAFATFLGSGFDVNTWVVYQLSDRTTFIGGQFNNFDGVAATRSIKILEPETGSSELLEVGSFSGIYRPSDSSWTLNNETFSGDDSGVVLSMNSSGQLQYTSTNLSGTLQQSQAKFTIIRL